MSSSGRAEACAICGGEAGPELLRIETPDRFERHVGVSAEGYLRRWVECSGCGVAANIIGDDVLERLEDLNRSGYYEVDLQGANIGDKYRKVMSLPPEESDNAGRVSRILSFLETWGSRDAVARRVIDIGAGTGVFLSLFLREGSPAGAWSALAVEPDPIAAAHLRSLGAFDVEESTYAPDRRRGGFDLVTLNKVVEHVADPVAFLSGVATALDTPGGLMYVEVPDKATLFHRAPSDNILGALHRHLYSVRSLDEALRRAGLEVLAIERVIEPSGKLSLAAFATTPSALRAHFTRAG